MYKDNGYYRVQSNEKFCPEPQRLLLFCAISKGHEEGLAKIHVYSFESILKAQCCHKVSQKL